MTPGPLGEARVYDIPATNGHGDPEAVLAMLRASEIRPASIRWVYLNLIPARMMTLLAGMGGVGKTVLALWLAARLTRGQLPGDWYGYPADVIYVGAEDDYATVQVPRLIAAGADLERVHFLRSPAQWNVAHAQALADRIEALPDVAAVILDPIDAFLGTADSHKKAEVQRAVGYLVETLTTTHRLAVIGLAHLSKADSVDVVKRVIGSIGFTTSARAVFAVGTHPENPNHRIMVSAKANAAAADTAPALRFTIEGTTIPDPEGGEIKTAQLVMLGEEFGVDPNVILSAPGLTEHKAREAAAEWLRDLLADGPMRSKEVEAAANDCFISRATLHRAREAAGVVIDRDETARGRPSTWRLGVSSHDTGSIIPATERETKYETGSDQHSSTTTRVISLEDGIETKPLGSNRVDLQ